MQPPPGAHCEDEEQIRGAEGTDIGRPGRGQNVPFMARRPYTVANPPDWLPRNKSGIKAKGNGITNQRIRELRKVHQKGRYRSKG